MFSFSISLLSVTISFDICLFNGKSMRHPSADQLIDDLCEQLRQVIQIYESTSLSKKRYRLYFSYFENIISEDIGTNH